MHQASADASVNPPPLRLSLSPTAPCRSCTRLSASWPRWLAKREISSCGASRRSQRHLKCGLVFPSLHISCLLFVVCCLFAVSNGQGLCGAHKGPYPLTLPPHTSPSHSLLSHFHILSHTLPAQAYGGPDYSLADAGVLPFPLRKFEALQSSHLRRVLK